MLVAGSYEGYIWGSELRKSPKNLTLTKPYSYHSHLSAIKTVAVIGSAAVSGGNDETIKFYDLSTTTEIGTIHHTSTITSLSFFSCNLLLAGDAKGSLSIYHAADPITHIKTVKTHRKCVNSISVHSSGKVALTVGQDERLAMVDLVKGCVEVRSELGKEASIVRFDGAGENFFVVAGEKIGVCVIEREKPILTMDNEKRILCATSGNNGIIFTGGEDGNVRGWDKNSGKVAYSIEEAHSSRVKGIVVLSKNRNDNSDPYIVASASTDGLIRVWDVRMVNNNNGKTNPLTEENTGSRLTCLAGSSIKSMKGPSS